MCAVIGAVLKQPTSDDFVTLHRVFLESKIRGMHATGLSYVKNREMITVRHPVPADEFPFDFESYINEDGNLYLIGHCRYSTSDLEYNQPLSTLDKSIVHNGVITQELPENWKELYGYDCITKNDSELILHCENPLKEFSHMSMGVCELTIDKKLRTYRNGKRPLYLTFIDNGCIITSTKDIVVRSNIIGNTLQLPLGIYTTIDEFLAVEYLSVNPDLQDLQIWHENIDSRQSVPA